MKKYFPILFLAFLFAFVFAQNKVQYEIGLPLIHNYFPQDYKASSQNWGIAQDSRGVLYFANSDGVLEYDGIKWRLISIAKNYPASAIAIDDSNRIFVGSSAEFGYLAPNKSGNLQYKSLLDKFDPGSKKFNGITNIYSIKGAVYFIAGDKLYRWNNNNLLSWRLRKPGNCFAYKNNLLVWQKNIGIKKLVNDSLVKMHGGEYFAEMQLQNILPYYNNRMLIISKDSGMFLMSDPFKLPKGAYPTFTKFYNQVDYFNQLNQLLFSSRLSGGYYTFATMRGGTAIMDSTGALVQVLGKSTGIQNETHNSALQDKQNALWLALDNGISRAGISTPLNFWDDNLGLYGSALSIARLKGTIFVGTTQGMFCYSFSPEKYFQPEFVFNKNLSHFDIFKGIQSSTWDLLLVKNKFDITKNKLLAATSAGVYEVDLNSVKLICTGICNKLYQSKRDPSKIFVAAEDGVKCISVNYTGANLSFTNEGKLAGFDEKIENFMEDNSGRLWIASKYSGVYMVEFKKRNGNKIVLQSFGKTNYIFTHFDAASGLPSSVYAIHKIRNKLMFISRDGIYLPVENRINPDSISIKFTRDNSIFSWMLNKVLTINLLAEDAKGNIWVQLVDQHLGRKIIFEAIYKNGNYALSYVPFAPIRQMEISTIFVEEGKVVWFGGGDGLVKYDGNTSYNYKQEFSALVRKVILNQDSVVFWGTYFKNSDSTNEFYGLDTVQAKVLKPSIAYRYNHITFEYAAPSYYDESSKLFKVFLEGFDKNWSEWTSETNKEYTNLQPGRYKFHVIAKNIFDNYSKEAVYEFLVKPPWYRTNFAYIVYVVALALFIFASVRFSNKRLREAKLRLEEEIRKRTAELNAQKKEIEKEKEKSEKLLLNILPFKIADELKANGHAKTKTFGMVSVMFTDFKDFTVIAQQLEPQELIADLNRCFIFFDDVCVRHKIEKIKTIGDAYMCAGGVPLRNRTNPVDLILAAIEIRDFIGRLKKEQAEKGRTLWKIRIGIHTGPIISGVVGKKKFAYDIWGDTVNTASRLEQTSFPNKINISGATFELVKDFFVCTYRGKVPVKNKGEIDMYFAESIKAELSLESEGRIPNQQFWELYEKLND